MRRDLTNKLDEVADDIYWDGYADGIAEYKELVMNYMKENNLNINLSALDTLEWELIDTYDIKTELNDNELSSMQVDRVEFKDDNSRSMFEQILKVLGGEGNRL